MLPTSTATNIAQNGNWTSTKGNRSEYVYYAGVEAGNPSGNIENIKQIDNYNGYNVLIFSINYEWDTSDRVVKETCV